MTAQEARQNAKEYNTGQLEPIMSIIKKSAEKGEFFIWYYESLKKGTREGLEYLGYTVGPTQFERNETLTKISW